MPAGDNLGPISILTPPALRQSATFRDTIERYFQVCLFLLIVTGFVTLTTTGRLDSVSIVAVSAALLFRAYLILRGRTLQIPERWTSYLTLLYIVFYIADIFLVSGSYVVATVHLVLFVMVVKIFSVRRDRDHLYLAVISFLEVLAAAVLTVDTVFFAAFSVFLLLAVATFITLEMKRSAAASLLPSAASPGGAQRMARSLSAGALVIAAAIIVAAAAIFFVLPRLSAGYLSAYAPHNEFVSGFSDRVELGEIGRIKQSDSIVMHVEIEGERGSYADLKWRGVALALFDGTQWSNPVSSTMEAIPPGNVRYDPDLRSTGMARYNLLRAQTGVRNLPEGRADVHALRPMFYKILMEPIGTNVLFLAPYPSSVHGRMAAIGVDESGAVYNLDRNRMTESYSAASLWAPSPQRLSRLTGNVPADVTMVYTGLPPHLDPRISGLAQQITANLATPYEKAAAIENYLQSHYGYSLQMAAARPSDPLAYFLFERKQGHCEYFASAMAIMLRTVGIPARIVNGFHGGEYNDVTGSYIVRARDAHSWVEVYIPGYAWVSFDPTPPDPRPAAGSMHRFLLYLDAAREFWREWVINYDFLHQRTLTISAMARGRSAGDQTRTWLRRRYDQLLSRARRVHQAAERSPRTWATGAVLAVLAAVLTGNLRRLWRFARHQRLAGNPARAPEAAAGIWYGRMTRMLGRKGFLKKPAQTPREFVATIGELPLQNSVAAFTRHYERARFGNSPDDAAKLPDLFHEIQSK